MYKDPCTSKERRKRETQGQKININKSKAALNLLVRVACLVRARSLSIYKLDIITYFILTRIVGETLYIVYIDA